MASARTPTAVRRELWDRLSTAVTDVVSTHGTPLAVVDLDAFDANAADLVRRAAGVPIRVASKSLRVPELILRALACPGFQGILAFTVREALWLHAHLLGEAEGPNGPHDIVVGYPSVDRAAISALANDANAAAAITVMVDSVEQLDLLSAELSSAPGNHRLRVALDLDAGLDLAVTRVGPQRSPLYDTEPVIALAQQILARPRLHLVGVMTYEGQIAGLPDQVPGQRLRSTAVRAIKRASHAQVTARRARIGAALAGMVELEFWNAGGTGSLELSGSDPRVTELSAGSGLIAPTLFDNYAGFSPTPSAFLGLPVTRRPNQSTVTVHGGGLVASGPVGPDRWPTPWAPAGLRLTSLEGAGEVQTPLVGPGTDYLRVGDLVWFRHAKAGELFEHVTAAHLISGSEVVSSALTYRGHGLAF